MSTEVASAVYWDGSAVLSALFRDRHSDEASKRARESGVHFLSTLGGQKPSGRAARTGLPIL